MELLPNRSPFAYFGELGPKCPFFSLERILRAWRHHKGLEADFQVGLQVASEPQAAVGTLTARPLKLWDCLCGTPAQQVFVCLFWGARPEMPFLQSERGSEGLGAF